MSFKGLFCGWNYPKPLRMNAVLRMSKRFEETSSTTPIVASLHDESGDGTSIVSDCAFVDEDSISIAPFPPCHRRGRKTFPEESIFLSIQNWTWPEVRKFKWLWPSSIEMPRRIKTETFGSLREHIENDVLNGHRGASSGLASCAPNDCLHFKGTPYSWSFSGGSFCVVAAGDEERGGYCGGGFSIFCKHFQIYRTSKRNKLEFWTTVK